MRFSSEVLIASVFSVAVGDHDYGHRNDPDTGRGRWDIARSHECNDDSKGYYGEH